MFINIWNSNRKGEKTKSEILKYWLYITTMYVLPPFITLLKMDMINEAFGWGKRSQPWISPQFRFQMPSGAISFSMCSCFLIIFISSLKEMKINPICVIRSQKNGDLGFLNTRLLPPTCTIIVWQILKNSFFKNKYNNVCWGGTQKAVCTEF